jgi:hypothetical protein
MFEETDYIFCRTTCTRRDLMPEEPKLSFEPMVMMVIEEMPIRRRDSYECRNCYGN